MDRFLKPFPMMMPEGTEPLASALSHSKRVRRGDDGGDESCAEKKDHASQDETREVEEDAGGLAYQEVAAEDAITDVDAVAEARPVWILEVIVKEVTVAEVVAPRTATNRTVVGEFTAFKASSGQAGQGEPREIMEEAMGEASADAETLDPPETAARASSDVALAPGTKIGMPVPEMVVDKAADPPHAGADANPEKVSQETPAAQTEEGNHGEASVTPGTAAKSASGGKTFTSLTRSGVGSQSSASQLQKEWVNTASSTGSNETSKTRARNLTLAELSKQLAIVKESLGNAGL
jgi:hypothetical protein